MPRAQRGAFSVINIPHRRSNGYSIMENTSPHILSTASNLLGFSFLVLTSIKSLGLPQGTIIDEITAVLIVVLALSCGLSFASIRSKNKARAKRLETIAEYFFMISLALITLTSILTGLNYFIFTT